MVENLLSKEQLGYSTGGEAGQAELSEWLDDVWDTPKVTPEAAPEGATPFEVLPSRLTPAQGSTGAPLDIKTIKMYNTYTKKKGSKATRNNNPGNITGMGGKLLYGAVGFAKSSTGDKGDQNQLVYHSEAEGFKAMHDLAIKNYSAGPIKQQFNKWQTDKRSFRHKLRDLEKFGINTSKSYKALSAADQKLFRKIWSQHEGYRGTFY